MKISGIYKIINPKGKIYIGQSIDIYGRWRYYELGHGSNQIKLFNSFKKYGFNKHKLEIICQCNSDELNSMEKYYVELFQCFNSEYGLNLKAGGGQQGVFSDETKKRMSISHIGIRPSEKTNKKRSESLIKSLKINKRVLSEERKQRIRLQVTGNKNPFFGKTHSVETKLRLSEIAKNRRGRKHSEETKRKISEAHKGKKFTPEHIKNMKLSRLKKILP